MEPRRIDLEDCLLAIWIVSWEAAAAWIWWPSALILAGGFAFLFIYWIERSKRTKRE